jgi:predicted TIM-barrel fold metal-dependent hydrolase
VSGKSASEIRHQLSHPIVDCDGHWLESQPILIDYIDQVAGRGLAERYQKARSVDLSWYEATDEERLRQRYRRSVWWPYPYKAYEHATFRLPKLYYERLDEIGIDFSIIYPTAGLMLEGIRDAEVRGAAIRAYNTMAAEMFRPYADRMTPVAVVPRRTPSEAIGELTHAVRELGFKAVMINGTVHRRSATGERYVDALGLDNEEDYDPLWRTCVELGVAVTSHAGSLTWSDHASVTNYVFNHVGHFAQANHVLAKAIFLGGVSYRFPTLNFGFLEGGTGWARNLYHDLLGHFEKRTQEAASGFLKPTLLDVAEFRSLVERYGDERTLRLANEVVESIVAGERGGLEAQVEREREHVHDFGAAGVTKKREIEDLFSSRFYFGCEADDPMTALAFDGRLGLPLKAVFSSDISHWDVPEVTDVVPEAYELVEHGLLSEKDFRAFTFTNAVHLHGEMNPAFFKGTVIETEVDAELRQATTGAQAS